NYCASLLARDATTGDLVWAYNLTPQDQWDLDEPGQNILVDMEIDGEMRHTLLKVARNGYVYVFDRATGEILIDPWPHAHVTYANGVDMETGRIMYEIDTMLFIDAADRALYTDTTTGTRGVGIEQCPGAAARNWYND